MSAEQILANRPLFGARLNMAHALAKDIIGCWLLNENGGIRALDTTPYINNGLLNSFNAPLKRSFNGLVFDGSGYINVSAKSIMNTSTFTIIFWISGKNTSKGIFAGNAPTYNNGLVLSVDANGKLATDIPFVANISVSNTAINTGNLYHCVISRNASGQYSTYINGILEVTATQGTAPVWSDWQIGKSDLAAISGRIWLFIFYRRLLIDNEVKAIYLSPYAPMGMKLFI